MRQRVNLRSPLFLQYESRPAEVESENLQIYSEGFSHFAWSKSNSSVSSNLIEAPEGSSTADKLIENTANSTHKISSTITSASNAIYTFSVFAKESSRDLFHLGMSDTSTGQASVLVNLAEGTIDSGTIPSGSWTDVSGDIENYGNGWYRVSVTGQKNAGTNLQPSIEFYNNSRTYTGDGVSGIYIFGAQVEQQEQATSYIKTEATTVTRAATTEAQEEDVTAELRIYSGGGGYDYERTNLQVRSEEFDNASWGKSLTTVTPNAIEAPNGELTADKLECNTTGGSMNVRDIFTITSGSSVTFSVYAKKGNSRYCNIAILTTSFAELSRVFFDLQEGTAFSPSQIGSSVAYTDSDIQDVGNGWYRLSLTCNTTGQTSLVSYIYGTTGNGTFGVTQGDYNYFWGAQAEEGYQATSYIKTEATTVTELAYQTEAPTEATYTLTKSPENGKTTFEIAELIRDYIEQTTTKSSGTIWADVKLFDNLQMNRHYYFLGTEGYIDNTEGLQTYLNAPSNETFMQSNSTVLVPEGQSLEIPVNAQYNSFYTITTGGVEGSAVYFSNLDDNSTQVEYITVNSTDEVVKLYVDSVVTEEITIQETECSKYADHLLMFVNKYGSKQDFYVNMKSTEKFRVKDDGFSRSVIDYSTLSVNNGIHSYKRRVLESKETYTLNTPFLDEENVQAFEELLLSEYVWLKKEGESYIPVIIKDMSMTRKTHLNDKLIQYTVEVESANHLVNKQR